MINVPPNFAPMPDRPGWHRLAGGDYRELEAQALALQRKIPEPAHVICGMLNDYDTPSIYLIEGRSAVEIAKDFGTGSHQTFLPPETEQVCEVLARIFNTAAFRPYFADPAGYKAHFRSQITRRQAVEIEQILLAACVGMEGYETGLDGEEVEYSDEGPILAPMIESENGIRLWWD
jgi:hypothetical protein